MDATAFRRLFSLELRGSGLLGSSGGRVIDMTLSAFVYMACIPMPNIGENSIHSEVLRFYPDLLEVHHIYFRVALQPYVISLLHVINI